MNFLIDTFITTIPHGVNFVKYNQIQINIELN